MMINRSTMNHRSRRDPQTALKMRLRELAASRVRFGYRRLTVMLRREGWPVNAKRIYRLYCRWVGGADHSAQEDRTAHSYPSAGGHPAK
jgi:hypothetical protein